MNTENSPYQDFYGKRRSETYGDSYTIRAPENHKRFLGPLQDFIDRNDLKSGKCLEIGSSGGGFQDMVEDYYGTDIAPELAKHYHKPYRVAVDGRYPFEDGFFDAIWTHAVFEHIPDLQLALEEVVRMLKPGGVLLFFPAWQCRPWAADGYAVRPYRDFGLLGKLVKGTIPIRNSIFWRSAFIFPKRLWRSLLYAVGNKPKLIRYRRLKANYTTFWTSDSDACNSIDAHDAILWFESRGIRCVSHPLYWRAFVFRTGGLVFQKQKRELLQIQPAIQRTHFQDIGAIGTTGPVSRKCLSIFS